MLNENIDWTSIQKQYTGNGYVRIENALKTPVAGQISDCLANTLPWEFYCKGRNEPRAISLAELESMTPEQLQFINLNLMAAAQAGFAFQYFRYADPYKHPELRPMFEYISGDEFQGFMKYVTGDFTCTGLDAQATCFRPSSFLTMHADRTQDKDRSGLSPDKYRRVAYVFGFTELWRSDWGGLLHIINKDKKIIDVFPPAYNTLLLFRVPTHHFVSQVASYAGQFRYSITGWLTGPEQAPRIREL